MQDQRVQEVYNSYFIFNNERTLSTDTPSELSVTDSISFTTYVDKTRRYDNQIVIRDICNLESLESSLGLFDISLPLEISVEPKATTPELDSWLSSHEFTKVFEHEFLQLTQESLQGSKDSSNAINVEVWGHSRVEDFLSLLKTSGVSCSDETWLKKRSLYCTEKFRCYVAFVNGIPCAWATCFFESKHAILANAYTQEEFRGSGCQKALLDARIKDAFDNGIEVLLTDVELNSTSSHNCKSFGFTSVGVKNVWCREI
ncbi:acetyltransferase [Enterovibrio norvegicus FF-162]|uniref:GNAT family N-acetyltransferase n=1 Tax=Enterovibrio norvegicus TaxID=188144 RepID=UPI00031AB30E|nr:GNAT family N-acetyltransferase [Enterovibrio norvegicus]OEE78795.1 acetyltransferase [Enterovibrio norvegicus FF-162]